MVIEVKDLQVGDEILVGAGCLKYIRILRPPKQHPTAVHWLTKDPMFKTVKYSTRRDEISYVWTGRTYTRKEFRCTPDEHNYQGYMNLNYKTLWLVNRTTI